MKKRVRMSRDEALAIGVEPRPADKGRSNTKYPLNHRECERLTEYRSKNAKIKRLFFDIETSPNIVYTWRAGYKINISPESIIEERKIICISYKWEGDDTVHSLEWDKDQDDKQMLSDFVDIIKDADQLVGHNGDRFDLKWIRTRCLYHRLPMFPTYRTLDTLKKARSSFYFNSNRLDYIAQFLGVGAKTKHEGFQMWVKVMEGEAQALKDMIHYCENDVIILEDVYQAISNYTVPNTHAGVVLGLPKYSCPQCACQEVTYIKQDVTPRGTISRILECDECSYTYKVSNSTYMQRLKDLFS